MRLSGRGGEGYKPELDHTFFFNHLRRQDALADPLELTWPESKFCHFPTLWLQAIQPLYCFETWLPHL